MKRHPIYFAMLILLLTGCTSRYTVGSTESGADFDYEWFNSHVQNQQCIMLLSTGEEKMIEDIYCSKDSISWMVPSTISINVPTSRISGIQPGPSGTSDQKIITFTNGKKKIVNDVIVTQDSISWIEPSLMTVFTPTAQISKITYFNRSRGFIEGLWKGAIAGTATFLSIYLPSSDNHDSALARLVGGLAIGGGILLASPFVGAIIGHTEEYQFKEHITQ